MGVSSFFTLENRVMPGQSTRAAEHGRDVYDCVQTQRQFCHNKATKTLRAIPTD